MYAKYKFVNEAGGWLKVIEQFLSDYVTYLRDSPKVFVLLLIDFDQDEDRLAQVKGKLPGSLAQRVFVLGALGEPEDLKKAGLGSYETIGLALARDCQENTDTTWGHKLLRHNASELARLREHVRPILFK